MVVPSSPRRKQIERMGSSGSLKHRFLNKWITSLQSCSSSKNLSSLTERKKFIKLSADLTMASLRHGSTHWSRAVIENAASNAENKLLVEEILPNGASSINILKNSSQLSRKPTASSAKKIRSKKIVKRSRTGPRRSLVSTGCYQPTASSIAKRLLKKRTQLLKNLVPGGDSMNDMSLIKETLDYIVSLQAQVDVMRSLARASELLRNGK